MKWWSSQVVRCECEHFGSVSPWSNPSQIILDEAITDSTHYEKHDVHQADSIDISIRQLNTTLSDQDVAVCRVETRGACG